MSCASGVPDIYAPPVAVPNPLWPTLPPSSSAHLELSTNSLPESDADGDQSTGAGKKRSRSPEAEKKVRKRKPGTERPETTDEYWMHSSLLSDEQREKVQRYKLGKPPFSRGRLSPDDLREHSGLCVMSCTRCLICSGVWVNFFVSKLALYKEKAYCIICSEWKGYKYGSTSGLKKHNSFRHADIDLKLGMDLSQYTPVFRPDKKSAAVHDKDDAAGSANGKRPSKAGGADHGLKPEAQDSKPRPKKSTSAWDPSVLNVGRDAVVRYYASVLAFLVRDAQPFDLLNGDGMQDLALFLHNKHKPLNKLLARKLLHRAAAYVREYLCRELSTALLPSTVLPEPNEHLPALPAVYNMHLHKPKLYASLSAVLREVESSNPPSHALIVLAHTLDTHTLHPTTHTLDVRLLHCNLARELVSQKVREIIASCGIDQQAVVAVVHEPTPLLVDGLESAGLSRVMCAAEMLDAVVKSALDQTPAVRSLLLACKALVPHKILFNEFSVLKNFDAFAKLARQRHPSLGNDVNLLSQVLELLSPFNGALRLFETEKPVSMVLPVVFKLLTSLTADPTRDRSRPEDGTTPQRASLGEVPACIHEFRYALRRGIEAHQAGMTHHHKAATFLDPRFSKDMAKWGVDQAQQDEVAKSLVDELVTFAKQNPLFTAAPTIPLPSIPPKLQDVRPVPIKTAVARFFDDEWQDERNLTEDVLGLQAVDSQGARDHDSTLRLPNPLSPEALGTTLQNMIERELSMYNVQPALHVSEDPLSWWVTASETMPTLRVAAVKYLSIPATLVGANAVLPQADAQGIVEGLRRSLSDRSVEESLFLRRNVSNASWLASVVSERLKPADLVELESQPDSEAEELEVRV